MSRGRAAWLVSSLAAILIALTACASKGAGRTTVTQHSITMTVSFSPNPPRRGAQAVDVTIVDRTGHTITRAFVEATLLMPQATAQTAQAYEDDRGHYVMPFDITATGRARFVITATTEHTTLRATVPEICRR